MLFHFDSLGFTNWASSIKNILLQYGCGHVWKQQGIDNESHFIIQLFQRMKYQFIVDWKHRISENRKLILYHQFKTKFYTKTYLDVLKIRKFISLFASFRIACHPLEIEKGRHYNILKRFKNL